MVKNLVCGAIVACLLAVNVAMAGDCGCATPAPSCGCSSCQARTCCDPCCNPLGTALKNIGSGLKTGFCHLKGGVERLFCPIRFNGSCGCGGCTSSIGCGDCVGCGAGVPPVTHYGSPMIENAPVWDGQGVPTPPTPPMVEEPTSIVPEPARFQPPGSWKSAQVSDVKPAGKANLYYSKVIAEKSGVSRVSHSTKSGVYFAAPKSK
ncbi:hypothetical protein [Blastopirellula retiformator]|uniref:Uncharacterized protein n=1 Tax=Blastopirellula retiformator TaxID=2527970 RepID=A0A5C5V9Z6_9BACT|nr:hypothetical protein [Blastopirellula retiformator]TWT34475.1 hypothetical protein Enr8_18840 [Blastopirellula retiformator]